MTYAVRLLLAATLTSLVLGQSITLKDIGTPTSGGSSSTVCIPNCEITLFGAGDACPDYSSAAFIGSCNDLNTGAESTISFRPYGDSGCDDFKVHYINHQLFVTGNSGQFNLGVNILKCYLSVESGQCAPNSPPDGGCDVQ